MPPRLLTELQAAEALSVPPSWLAARRRRGLIPYTALGERYVRYSDADIDEIIRRHQVRAAKGRAS